MELNMFKGITIFENYIVHAEEELSKIPEYFLTNCLLVLLSEQE